MMRPRYETFEAMTPDEAGREADGFDFGSGRSLVLRVKTTKAAYLVCIDPLIVADEPVIFDGEAAE